MDEFIQENLSSGCICPSKLLSASPVFFIKKKDGTLWLMQDYWALNTIMIKNWYPLPLISELINQLHGEKFFTKLNVRWGYNNIHMKAGDKWKAAFRMNHGLFEPLVMFFGLTNSASTFQTMILSWRAWFVSTSTTSWFLWSPWRNSATSLDSYSNYFASTNFSFDVKNVSLRIPLSSISGLSFLRAKFIWIQSR